jgi:cytochrome c5
MKQIQKILLPVCSMVLALGTSSGAVAADDGSKVFEEICTACHTPKKNPLEDKRLTRDQWAEAIERMAGYGAEVPKARMASLLDYLVRSNGPPGAATEAAKK